jgi:hypothetical protein
VLVVDALRYSLLLERKAYAALARVLRAIEKRDGAGAHPSEAQALSAIANAWHIIDVVHRVRGLLVNVPGLSKKAPEVQVFLRHTAATEDFRNIYQHLGSEIARICGTTNPIMGVVSWATRNPRKSMTVFVGTGADEIEVHTVALDTWKGEFAQGLLFSAGGKDIELDRIHFRCRQTSRYLDAWLRSSGHLSDDVMGVGLVRFERRNAV